MRHFAIMLGLLGVFLEAGCAHRPDRSGELLQASEDGNVAVVKSLIAYGVNLNVRDSIGATPLLLSIKSHPDVARLLVENGAELNVKRDLGASALEFAIAYHPELARLMMEKGADVNFAGQDTPLGTAAGRGNPDLVKELLDRGADVRPRTSAGYTALHFAAVSSLEPNADSVAVARLLLKAGVGIDRRTDGGETALSFAVWAGDGNLVRFLIDAGASVNHKSRGGLTPLHLAAGGILTGDGSGQTKRVLKDSHLRIAEELLASGADPNAVDDDGLTPPGTARKFGHQAMVELLEGWKGTPASRPGLIPDRL